MEIGETVKMSAISVSEESSIAVKKADETTRSLDFTDLLVLHADTFLLLRSTLADKMTDIALTILAYGKTYGRPTMLI